MGPERMRVAAIVLGVAVAAFGLLSMLDDPAQATPGARGAGDDPAASAPSILAPQGRAAPSPPPDGDLPGPRRDDVTPAAQDDGEEPDGSPLFPPLEVTVRLSDGAWPVGRKGRVYALWPGASGAEGPVAREELSEDGTATLRLPEPGRYDVGVLETDELTWALATDVVVDATATPRLELRMPPTEELRFVPEPGVSLPPGHQVLRPAEGPRAVAMPGRGEVREVARRLELSDLPKTWRAPAGVEFTLERGLAVVRASPYRFAAPATVTIRGDPGLYVLHVRIEPQDRVEPTEGVLTVSFEIEGNGIVDRWGSLSGVWDVEAGQRLGDVIRSSTFRQSPPAVRSLVRWRGEGIVAGSVEMFVPDGATVDVPIVVRRDEAKPLLPPPTAVIRIEGDVAAAETRLLLMRVADSYCDRRRVWGIGDDLVVSPRPDDGPIEILAAAPDRASDPMPLLPGRRHDLALRLGGYLRVVRGVRPPDGVELWLRRRDGLPFCDGTPEIASIDAVHEIALDEAEVRIGPFPEGEITFVVRSASATVAEVTARVVPCRTVDLVLPLAERLGRR